MTEKKRLVVINDDPTQLRFLGRILERSAYEVRMYLDAADALVGLASQPRGLPDRNPQPDCGIRSDRR